MWRKNAFKQQALLQMWQWKLENFLISEALLVLILKKGHRSWALAGTDLLCTQSLESDAEVCANSTVSERSLGDTDLTACFLLGIEQSTNELARRSLNPPPQHKTEGAQVVHHYQHSLPVTEEQCSQALSTIRALCSWTSSLYFALLIS